MLFQIKNNHTKNTLAKLDKGHSFVSIVNDIKAAPNKDVFKDKSIDDEELDTEINIEAESSVLIGQVCSLSMLGASRVSLRSIRTSVG